MIKTVVGQYHWPPDIIGGLYYDKQDYHGLPWWYDEVGRLVKEIKELNTAK